jgi:hypothetical protein
MIKYIKQYDLPCYPDDTPKPNCRNIIGLEKGDTFNHTFRGHHKWMGGCGIGLINATKTQKQALDELLVDVRKRLQARVAETTKRLVWEQDQLNRWTEDPEQFEVQPEGE